MEEVLLDLVDYNGITVVTQHPHGFQGWEMPDTDKPVWQTLDGSYVPLRVMTDDHVIACYQMINESMKEDNILKSIFGHEPESLKHRNECWMAWEEALFNEANNRGFVTKLYD